MWPFSKKEQLSPNFMADVKEESLFTPDNWYLDQFETMYVFVYNECMSRYSQHKLLGKDATKLAPAYTKAKDYVMLKKCLGKETFPFALQMKADNQFGNSSFLGKPARIVGEIYAVYVDNIKILDNYLLNTVYFNRQRIEITVPYRPDEGRGERTERTIKCWMYVGNYDFWKDIIDNQIEQVKLYTANEGREDILNQYYFFNEKLECSPK